MTLRLKLVLIALVTLLLPWAGFQFIKQMELLLREGQERAIAAPHPGQPRSLRRRAVRFSSSRGFARSSADIRV